MNNVSNKGLSNSEVVMSRKKYGSNDISMENNNSFFKLLLESLGDPIIKILLIALGIKTVFLFHDFDWFETIGIVIAIFIASFISTISEYGSEQAFTKIQEEASKIKCKVRREGKEQLILIDEVVVGDILLLQPGDKIPADGKIIEGKISVDESSLTGEAKEVYKETNDTLFRGTVVYSNNCVMKVTKVGKETFYGRMSEELNIKQEKSPLKERLTSLAKIISKIGYIGAILVSISYLFSKIVIDNHFSSSAILSTITNFPQISGYILYALTLSVTIIVVAVPEGLPMMITLVLSSNMKRMLKNNVLVRKLVGIETAGNINILFTDKTGTLTKGTLSVTGIYDSNLYEYKNPKQMSLAYKELIKKSLIYNNEGIYTKKEVIGGNITDKALLNFMKEENNKLGKSNVVCFDSKKKYSSCVIDGIRFIKGSYEKLLPACRSCYDRNGKKSVFLNKKKVEEKIEELNKKGSRILLLATSTRKEDLLCDLTLVGFVVIKDEVRKEAIKGIDLVDKAGIWTVMITGDNKNTAINIAKEVGIIKNEQDVVLESSELNKLSDEELKKIIPNLKVVARSLPQDKSRLIRVTKEMDLVVGMTGDGVNDAPALKNADVGFAMGSGTEVSKEASDIVILDDNFLSIAKAIMYGRTIFKSIRKFIIFQLTVNLCAISLSIIGPFIGMDTPVTVIQMLWVNMVMDTLAGIAFSYEPPLEEYMEERPKEKREHIINKYMLNEILFTGGYSALLCVFFLKSPFIKSMFRLGNHNQYLLTAFFGLFIFIGIFNSFNARTCRINILSNIFKNKVFLFVILFIIIIQTILIYHGGSLFRTYGLTIKEFYFMVLLAFSVIPVDWLRKFILRKKGIIGGV